MKTINPYLSFDGNCEEAFEFYKSVFGGEFTYMGRFSEMPAHEGMPPVSEELKNRIMHVSLKIGDMILMGSDTAGGCGGPGFQIGNNISLAIGLETKEEADGIFLALSKGGKAIMPMADMFWGDYYGMLVDKFGVNWMVSSMCK